MLQNFTRSLRAFRTARSILARWPDAWARPNVRSLVLTMLVLVPTLAPAQATGGQSATLVAGCSPVTSPPQKQDIGCFIVAQGHLPPQSGPSVYWQLRRFDRREQAEIARGAHDLIAEAEGSAWLFRFGPRHDRDGPGEYVTDIGPLELPLTGAHHVVILYSSLYPGAYTPVHQHAGPEAWHLLSGEQCLETPAGAQVQQAGASLIAPAGTPMQLTTTGTGLRRALAVVVHDPEQHWTELLDTWRPRGLCQQAR